MATISFPVPSNLASFLSANFPGVASATVSGGTIALEVPSMALPAPVVVGLNQAGFQVPASVGATAAPGAAPVAVPVAAPAVPAAIPEDVAAGAAQFAPAGFVPQGAALEDPNLAGAAAFAQSLSAQASSFFQQAASQGEPISPEQFATFAAQQNAALSDYLFGA